MEAVVIYHVSVSKLVFIMKISFVITIIVNHQTFRYLLILLFRAKIIVYRRKYQHRQNIIAHRENHYLSWKLLLIVEVLGLSKQYQEFGKPRKLKQ